MLNFLLFYCCHLELQIEMHRNKLKTKNLRNRLSLSTFTHLVKGERSTKVSICIKYISCSIRESDWTTFFGVIVFNSWVLLHFNNRNRLLLYLAVIGLQKGQPHPVFKRIHKRTHEGKFFYTDIIMCRWKCRLDSCGFGYFKRQRTLSLNPQGLVLFYFILF